MDREEFIELLGRLVADGELTEGDAAELLRQFDAGELPVGWQLPLPPGLGVGASDQDAGDSEEALLVLLALLASMGLADTGSASYAQRLRLADSLQDAFEITARNLAARLTAGEITVAEWQIAMLSAVRQNAINQMRVASGRADLSRAQRQRLDQLMRRQSAYLQRFADHLAGRMGLGAAFSEAQIALRSALYGGFARAEFFVQAETEARFGPGWVFRYVAVDDQNTCGPCVGAEGYYMAGQGPMPGEICLGRSRCRCYREPVYDPARYASVLAEPAGATIR